MNQLGLNGIEFIEFSCSNPTNLHKLFLDFGFSKIGKHKDKNIDWYKQGDINFLLNYEPSSYGYKFQTKHGPSISAMGWKFNNASAAHIEALKRGATLAMGDYSIGQLPAPAIGGIGDSLIYFVDSSRDKNFSYTQFGFENLQDPIVVPDKGFVLIDHLTNNVFKGTMIKWSDYYKNIFGFTEVRYFDIKGKKTGLTSYALRSPCGTFCIPINEASESKSQINEFLDEYNGPGVQHLAFLTRNLLNSLEKLQETNIETLEIGDNYYLQVFERVPNVKEDKKLIEKYNVLVDGDEHGYLLQIFTKKLIGPIFIELIQRENHLSFGEGNFQALFDSIELDQIKRGVL